MKRKMPIIQSPPTSSLAVANFRGVNQNDDPKNLLKNVFTVIRNCFINRGVFEKRGGSDKEGDSLTSKHTEEFTATTKKDAISTTANWDTSAGKLKLNLTMAEGVDQQNTTNNTYEVALGGWPGSLLAQSFIAGGSYVLDKLQIYGLDTSGFNSVDVYLYSDSSDRPDEIIATKTNVSVSSSLAWSDVVFATSPSLVSGTKYWIVVVSGWSASQGYKWYGNTTSSYANGSAKWYIGRGDWEVPDTADFCFKVYAKATYDTTNNIGQSIGFDSTSGSQTYSASVVSTLNGGSITVEYSDSTDNSNWGAWTTDISTLNKRYIRFRVTLTGTSIATPEVDKIEITYGGVPVTGGAAFYKTTGDKFLVVTAGTSIKKRDAVGTGWTDLGGSLTSGKRSFYVTFNDLLIHVNATEAPKKWNGSDASVSALGGTPPTAKGVEVHINRVWMFADKSSILKWSALNNAEDWTTTQDAGSVNIYTQDNDYIQGIKSLREQLCVLKENSIHVILGYSPSTFQAYQRSTTAGCVAQGSIQSDGNSIFFLDRDAIYEFDGAYVKPIHLPIIDDIEDINQAYVHNASSMIYKNMYFISFPTGDSATNNVTWVLDLNDPNRENWVRLDGFDPGVWIVFNAGASNTPTPYFGDQTENSIVYQFDTGNSDYGQAIDMDIQTKEYGRAEMLNFFKQLAIFLRATTGSYNLSIYYALNGSSSWTLLGNATSDTIDTFTPLQIVEYASTVKFRFRNNEKDQPMTLTRFALEMSEREFRRT